MITIPHPTPTRTATGGATIATSTGCTRDPSIPGTLAMTPSRQRRRRRAVLALVMCLSALGLGARSVLTGPGGVPASAAGTGTAPPVRTVRVEAGDSLWAIAERHHAALGFGDYLDALVRLNGGTAIAAGQLVRLP